MHLHELQNSYTLVLYYNFGQKRTAGGDAPTRKFATSVSPAYWRDELTEADASESSEKRLRGPCVDARQFAILEAAKENVMISQWAYHEHEGRRSLKDAARKGITRSCVARSKYPRWRKTAIVQG